MKTIPTIIKDSELPTVLAALRYLQPNLNDAQPLFEECGYFEDYRLLNVEEIDQVCERLNGRET